MPKKIFLTSAITMCVVCPVFAAPLNTSATFPNDEYMLEDYTYQNQATYTNMGVYSGSVDILAEYDDIPYTVSAGYYLPAAGEAVAGCTAGNYCPGLQSQVYYNADDDQGLTSCATVGDGSYTLSANGSSANTDCYKACTTSNIEHSASVTGNDYYGAGVDTCSALTCESGWHVKQGLNLSTAIGTGAGASSAYIDGNNNFSEDGASYGQSFYGITSGDTNAFAVNYGNNGIIHGHGACSTTPGSNGLYTNGAYDENGNWSNTTLLSNLTDETGTVDATYCYCKIDGYKPLNGTFQSLSSMWGFNLNRGGVSDCASHCAEGCANFLQYDEETRLAFRATLLGSVPVGLASCAANVITINWTDVDPEYAGDNDEDTVTYGGDIRTPVKAVTKPGKTFHGWKFIKPSVTPGQD